MNPLATWHLLHTKPRQEQAAQEQLERQGYTTYLPIIKRTRQPLFPRYLFIRLTAGLENSPPIRSSLGVSSFVRMGMHLGIIPDQFIAAVRQRADTDGLHTLSTRYSNEEEMVKLAASPLASYEAIFSEQRPANRIIILLNLIETHNCTEVPVDFIAMP